MIVRRCDVLGCDETTSDTNPGTGWLRIEAPAYYIGDVSEWRALDVCSIRCGHELIDEIGERFDDELIDERSEL